MGLDGWLETAGTWGLILNGLRVVLGGMIIAGAVLGETSPLINSSLAVTITFLPSAIERRYDHHVDPRLSVWIAIAATVHAAGAFGPYDSQAGLWWWYDKVAHMISAGFIAGIGYSIVAALDSRASSTRFPAEFRVAFTLFFILAVGVTWEIIEFAAAGLGSAATGEEVVIQYGIEDTVLDLVFNTFAAIIVALWGTEYFHGISGFFTRRFSRSDNP